MNRILNIAQNIGSLQFKLMALLLLRFYSNTKLMNKRLLAEYEYGTAEEEK